MGKQPNVRQNHNSCLSKFNENKCVEFGAIDFIERIPYITLNNCIIHTLAPNNCLFPCDTVRSTQR